MKYKAALFLMVIIGFSCSQKKGSEIEDGAVRIEMDSKTDKTFKELVSENFFVKLETTDKSLLRYPFEVQLTKEYIFVGDMGAQGIFVFSFPEGKFIREVNHLGAGPGEYLGLNDFKVDEKAKTIEILDSNNKKIFKYDFEGQYIGFEAIDFTGAMEFFTLSSGDKIFSGILNEDKSNKKYQAFKTNGGKAKNNYIEVKKDFGTLIRSGHNLTKLQEQIYFNPIFSPAIYQLNRNQMQMKYYIDFGNHWIDNKSLDAIRDLNSYDKMIDKNNFVKSLNPVIGKHYISISYYLQKKNHFCLYDIAENKVYNVTDSEKGTLLEYGFEYFSNGYFISFKYPLALKEAFKKSNFDSSLVDKKFVAQLSSNDNPVLMFTKLIDKPSTKSNLQ